MMYTSHIPHMYVPDIYLAQTDARHTYRTSGSLLITHILQEYAQDYVLKMYLFVYLKRRATARERENFPVTSLLAATARSISNGNQVPGTPSRFSTWVVQPKHLSHHLLPSRMYLQAAGLDVEQPGIEPALQDGMLTLQVQLSFCICVCLISFSQLDIHPLLHTDMQSVSFSSLSKIPQYNYAFILEVTRSGVFQRRWQHASDHISGATAAGGDPRASSIVLGQVGIG